MACFVAFSKCGGPGSPVLAVLAAIVCSASSAINKPGVFDLLLPLAITCRSILAFARQLRYWNSFIRQHFAKLASHPATPGCKANAARCKDALRRNLTRRAFHFLERNREGRRKQKWRVGKLAHDPLRSRCPRAAPNPFHRD